MVPNTDVSMKQHSTDTSIDFSTLPSEMHYFKDAQTSRMLHEQPTCYDLEFDKEYYDRYDPGKAALLKHKMQVS